MLLKHKIQELYAKALYFPEDGMVVMFDSAKDKRIALLEGWISGFEILSDILKDWDVLPPSFDHLTAGDKVERRDETGLVQAVHGIGDLAVVLLVNGKDRTALSPYTIFKLKRDGFTLLPYDFAKPEETVKVGGKTYRKAEVEKALEGVKEVGK